MTVSKQTTYTSFELDPLNEAQTIISWITHSLHYSIVKPFHFSGQLLPNVTRKLPDSLQPMNLGIMDIIYVMTHTIRYITLTDFKTVLKCRYFWGTAFTIFL